MVCVCEQTTCVNVCDVMCERVAYVCECANVYRMYGVCVCEQATCVNMCVYEDAGWIHYGGLLLGSAWRCVAQIKPLEISHWG